MQVMGMRYSLVWSVWLLWSCLSMLIISAILAVVMWLGDVLPNSNPLLIFLMLATFSVALVMFWYVIRKALLNSNSTCD